MVHRRLVFLTVLILAVAMKSTCVAAQAASTLDEATSLLGQGKNQEAKAVATDVLRKEPLSAEAHVVRGFAEEALKENAASIDDFNAALAINPQLEGAWYGKCTVFYQLERLDDAIAACTRAIALDPNDVAAYNQRGLAYDAKDDTANETIAIADLDRSIELEPNNAWSYSERCELKLEVKKYDAALSDCNHSLAIDPSSSWTWYQRGRLYTHAADYQHAESDFQRSIETGPAIPFAYCNLAQAQTELGKLQDALTNVNTCISRFPKSSFGYLTRANAYAKLGNRAYAIADAKQALALAKESSQRSDAQALVDKLTAGTSH